MYNGTNKNKVSSEGCVPKYTGSTISVTTDTLQFDSFGAASIPVPDTSVSPLFLNIGTQHLGKFGMFSITVPETSVSSVLKSNYTPGTVYSLDSNKGVSGICSAWPRYPTKHFGTIGCRTVHLPV